MNQHGILKTYGVDSVNSVQILGPNRQPNRFIGFPVFQHRNRPNIFSTDMVGLPDLEFGVGVGFGSVFEKERN